MTTVVNFNDVREHYDSRRHRWDGEQFIYIGRANTKLGLEQSPWANPIRLHEDTPEAREAAIDQYRKWLVESTTGKNMLHYLPILQGKTLVCHCKPKACHGDVLIELLEGKPIEAPAQQQSIENPDMYLPVLAWDGGAPFYSKQDKSGQLYYTSERIQNPLGYPGKVYTTWPDWYRDFLKMFLTVNGNAVASGMSQEEYACFCYETRLREREGRRDARSILEVEILHELIAELKV